MEFNQVAPYHPNGPNSGYPPQYMNPYYSANPNFGNPPPAGLHVGPHMAPPMDYGNTNYPGQYTNIYNNGYSFPPGPPSTAQPSFYELGRPARPPHEVRPTLHRNEDEWHMMMENCHAAFEHRNSTPVPRPSTKRKPRRSKSKAGTVEISIISTSSKRNVKEAPQSRAPTLDATAKRLMDRRPPTNPNASHGDRTPTPEMYRGGSSTIPVKISRQYPQYDVDENEDYEEDFIDSSPATPRTEFYEPRHPPSISMVPNTSQAGHPRSNNGTAANVARSRNGLSQAGPGRRVGPAIFSGREVFTTQPRAPEAPRYGNANLRNYHRQRGEEDQMRAARAYMEPPGGVNADDHLIAGIEAMLDQHKRSRAGSTARSRVSNDDTDAAIVISALNMVATHFEQRNREGSAVSALRDRTMADDRIGQN